MSEQFYDAIVTAERHEHYFLLSVIFTEDGQEQITPERFEQFQTACCGESVTLTRGIHGSVITGYTCAHEDPVLISMWGIAKLTHATFGVDTDVHLPPEA